MIGPIGASGSDERALADDLMRYIIEPCPALTELGYDPPVRADQLSEPGRITSQIIKLILSADLVISDLTGNNANVYYELSLRHALGKPVIHMSLDKAENVSFDIRDNRTIFSSMHARSVEAAVKELDAQVRKIHQPGYRPANPILETLGIVALEKQDGGEGAALAAVLQAIERLQGDVSDLHTAVDSIRPPADKVISITPSFGAGKSYNLSRLSTEHFLRAWAEQTEAKNQNDDAPKAEK